MLKCEQLATIISLAGVGSYTLLLHVCTCCVFIACYIPCLLLSVWQVYRKLHTVTACMHMLCFYTMLYSLLIAISWQVYRKLHTPAIINS